MILTNKTVKLVTNHDISNPSSYNNLQNLEPQV